MPSPNHDSTTETVAPSSAWTVFKQPHFSPFKCYLRRDLKLAVLLNPKVGSTAFRSVLVEGLTQNQTPPQLGSWWPLNRTRRYTTAPISDYFHAFRNPAEYDFRCFVRNPYSRVLSAWNDKLVKGFNQPEYPRSMQKFVPKLRKWAAENNLPGAIADSPFPFPSFISFIESQAEGSRNQHWDTQSSVLLTDFVRYRHIYQMETDFVTGMAATLGRVGIPEDWVSQKLQRPTNASGRIEKAVFNAELAERVYQIYQKDFERFGYDRDSWQDL